METAALGAPRIFGMLIRRQSAEIGSHLTALAWRIFTITEYGASCLGNSRPPRVGDGSLVSINKFDTARIPIPPYHVAVLCCLETIE